MPSFSSSFVVTKGDTTHPLARCGGLIKNSVSCDRTLLKQFAKTPTVGNGFEEVPQHSNQYENEVNFGKLKKDGVKTNVQNIAKNIYYQY